MLFSSLWPMTMMLSAYAKGVWLITGDMTAGRLIAMPWMRLPAQPSGVSVRSL